MRTTQGKEKDNEEEMRKQELPKKVKPNGTNIGPCFL